MFILKLFLPIGSLVQVVVALITEILCRVYGACLKLISFFYPLSFLGGYTIHLVTTLPTSD